MRLALLLLLLVAAIPARGAEDTSALARQAAALLTGAAEALREARDARNRLSALGRAVQAHEAALAALRAALRAIDARRASLSAEADASAGRLALLVAALQGLERTPGPLRMVHPGGPVAAARAGQLIAGMLPDLDAQRLALETALAELDRLRDERRAAEEMMRQGLVGLQASRAALADALARRTTPPVPEPGLAARLRADARSLERLAEALAPPVPDAGTLTGALPLPVQGRVALRFGDRDATGRQRAGVTIEAPVGALVTAPIRATVRYTGALPELGRIAILEPRAGWLIVLAGLGRIDRIPGEVLEPGEPVGVLGDLQAAPEGFLIAQAGPDPQTRPETLYMEIRQDGVPVDPAAWFRLGP